MDLEELKKFVVKKLDELKVENIEVIDVKQKTTMTDCIIIGTGRSDKHIESTVEHLKSDLKDNGIKINKADGKSTGWMILDLLDIIVHVFTEENRKIYNLEGLWGK